MGNVQFSPNAIPDEPEWPDVMGVGPEPHRRATLEDFRNLAATLKRDEEQQKALQESLQAPPEPSIPEDGITWPKEWKGSFLGKFDQSMTFRDFLRIKKEVLDAYDEYTSEMSDLRYYQYYTIGEGADREDSSRQLHWQVQSRRAAGKSDTPVHQEWPEALKGLTREDIEILKQ